MQLVQEVLGENPRTRNSDKLLMIKVWEKQLGKIMHPQLVRFFLDEAINPETITRTRRKLQQNGLYKANKEVEDQRYQNFVDAKYSGGRSITNV